MFRQYRIWRLRRLIACEHARIRAYELAFAGCDRVPVYYVDRYVEACERQASLSARLNQLLSN